MNCPKCLHQQQDSKTTCDACGIIFEKYYQYHPKVSEVTVSNEPEAELVICPSRWQLLKRYLFYDEAKIDSLMLMGRVLVFLFISIWGIRLMMTTIASNAVGESFMHLINLPFHEFGHILFRPFGQFITSLGGTLGQLLMPLICGGTLLIKTRDPFGASVALWWFGENFLDIAPYMNDARAGDLPLVGGNFGHSSPYGFHDWEYLLTESGLLKYDHILANLSFFIGSVIMLVSLVWAGLLLWQQYNSLRANDI